MNEKDFIKYMRDFLILCKKELKLEKLPRIIWMIEGTIGTDQPTFGRFNNKDETIKIIIVNRNILDICRTLAHELAHYKQWLNNKIGPKSGLTGSPQENEAHAIAGIIMRHFGKKYPELFTSKPLISK